MERDTLPLSRESLAAMVNAALSIDNTLKKLTFLLLAFTGIRNDTFCHIYAPGEWITASANDVKTGVKLKVPGNDLCRKYGHHNPCGGCNAGDREKYTPKTPAGEGRTIPIPNTYKNHAAGPADGYKEEHIGLADLVTTYFKVDENDHGHHMPSGDGLSKSTVNKYVKQVAQQAHKQSDIDLKFERGVVEHDQLGEVPDIFPHDLRGTYIVQCIRNDLHRTKLIAKTGHKSVESLEPYEEFAQQEVDAGYLEYI